MQTENLYNKIDKLISLYLLNELDKESLIELTCWCEASEENRKYIYDRLEIWFSTGALNNCTLFDKKKAFMRFERQIKNRRKVKKHTWKIVYRIAAIFLLLLLPFAGYWRGVNKVKQNFANIIVEAPLGTHTKLYLPDGTMVMLNAGSRMEYSQGFGVDDRKLTLEGEGYFEVIHNKKVPFVINTNELDLQVLGTKFNFKNYPDDEEVIVNLINGKVSLTNKLKTKSELYLDTGEKAVLNKKSGTMEKVMAKVENSNLWIDGELYFDDELLEDIVEKLERSFDVEIEVTDSLKKKRFYGSFKIKGNTIEKILQTISSTNHVNYRYEDKVYMLY